MTRGHPWLRLKAAASLDGKTARTMVSVSGSPARMRGATAMPWRARACAILTGIGTVRDDNPQLNVRDVETPRQPLRVVVDSRLETPLDARILQGGTTLIVGAVENVGRIEALRSVGAEVLILPNASGKVDLAALLTAWRARASTRYMPASVSPERPAAARRPGQ